MNHVHKFIVAISASGLNYRLSQSETYELDYNVLEQKKDEHLLCAVCISHEHMNILILAGNRMCFIGGMEASS